MADETLQRLRHCILPAALGLFSAAAPAHAEKQVYTLDYDVWCGEVGYSTLLSAKGVPAGDNEDFTFKGECFLYLGAAPGPDADTDIEKQWLKVLKGDPTLPTMPLIFKKAASPDFMIDGTARWSRTKQTAVEQLKFSGDANGTVTITYNKCYSDPFLLGAPKCQASGASQINITAPDAYRDHLIAGLHRGVIPLFWRRFDYNTAAALSQKQGEGAPPPPPPKPNTPKQSPADGAPAVANEPPAASKRGPVITAAPDARAIAPGGAPDSNARGRVAQIKSEAEAMLSGGALQVDKGDVREQDMKGFGPSWSGGRQVFWAGGDPGSAMTLSVAVDHAATYSIQMGLTQAPDYANLAFEVDGARSTISFSGYDPAVKRSLVPVGSYRLDAGRHAVRLVITGKNRSSSNYYAGVDDIILIELPDQ